MNERAKKRQGPIGVLWESRNSRRLTAIIVVFALPVLYVQSYAPIASWYRPWFPNWLYPFYRPVYWLAEETPLQRPLIEWSYLWHSTPPLRDVWRITNRVEPEAGIEGDDDNPEVDATGETDKCPGGATGAINRE